MKIRNNNPLDLEGRDGEVITVQITATGTVFAVSSDLDGESKPASPSFSFPLRKSAHDPSILVLFFIFSNNGGGIYNMKVTGSAGGDTAHYSVAQFQNEASNAIAYTFDIP